MQSKDGIKVYGLTHDKVKNVYILVFDKFGRVRIVNAQIATDITCFTLDVILWKQHKSGRVEIKISTIALKNYNLMLQTIKM